MRVPDVWSPQTLEKLNFSLAQDVSTRAAVSQYADMLKKHQQYLHYIYSIFKTSFILKLTPVIIIINYT